MLKKIYLTPLGYFISFFLNVLSILHKPFMVYGFYNQVTKKFQKNTRIGSSTRLISKSKLDVGDGVWVGHYCVLDASNCLKIGKGVQTGSHISIYTHSSHISIRLLGEFYLSSNDRIGYIDGAVSIGEYTFIGDSSIIFPGVDIGKGCLIKAGSIINSSIPDFSIVSGSPAKVVGCVTDLDNKFFDNKMVKNTYFDKNLLKDYNGKSANE
jgi:acetyltransferase-like isoleucine patch superfamily enzyme